ncbi:MAG: IPT/TIG domain-containing protein [Myxococcaceae bacterium]
MTTTVVVGTGASDKCQGPNIYGFIFYGGCYLSWNVGNQTDLSINNGIGDVSADLSPNAVGGSPNAAGQLALSPCPPSTYPTYTLTASNPYGTVTETIPVVPPTVGSVVPKAGPPAGGTPVTIFGNYFGPGATVTFGSAAATGVTVDSLTNISATTPPGTVGAVDVTVTNWGFVNFPQSGSLPGGFTYSTTAPTITSITPTSGPAAGGTPVTITGTNFESGAEVAFGLEPATNVVVNSPTSISATTPAGTPGPVNVAVISDSQTTQLPMGFTYIASPPTITSISPTSGPPAGGTPVTILGVGFQSGATVSFGSAAATGVSVTGPGSISATTPAGTAGSTVGVTVTNPDAQSGTLPGAFTYTSGTGGGPTINTFSVSPGVLGASGGTVTLSWNVTGATSLSINQGVGSVTPLTVGSVQATVGGNSTGQPVTVTFILIATNGSGTITASAMVTVQNI